jgi:hypothetical protein
VPGMCVSGARLRHPLMRFGIKPTVVGTDPSPVIAGLDPAIHPLQ